MSEDLGQGKGCTGVWEQWGQDTGGDAVLSDCYSLQVFHAVLDQHLWPQV